MTEPVIEREPSNELNMDTHHENAIATETGSGNGLERSYVAIETTQSIADLLSATSAAGNTESEVKEVKIEKKELTPQEKESTVEEVPTGGGLESSYVAIETTQSIADLLSATSATGNAKSEVQEEVTIEEELTTPQEKESAVEEKEVATEKNEQTHENKGEDEETTTHKPILEERVSVHEDKPSSQEKQSKHETNYEKKSWSAENTTVAETVASNSEDENHEATIITSETVISNPEGESHMTTSASHIQEKLEFQSENENATIITSETVISNPEGESHMTTSALHVQEELELQSETVNSSETTTSGNDKMNGLVTSKTTFITAPETKTTIERVQQTSLVDNVVTEHLPYDKKVVNDVANHETVIETIANVAENEDGHQSVIKEVKMENLNAEVGFMEVNRTVIDQDPLIDETIIPSNKQSPPEQIATANQMTVENTSIETIQSNNQSTSEQITTVDQVAVGTIGIKELMSDENGEFLIVTESEYDTTNEYKTNMSTDPNKQDKDITFCEDQVVPSTPSHKDDDEPQLKQLTDLLSGEIPERPPQASPLTSRIIEFNNRNIEEEEEDDDEEGENSDVVPTDHETNGLVDLIDFSDTDQEKKDWHELLQESVKQDSNEQAVFKEQTENSSYEETEQQDNEEDEEEEEENKDDNEDEEGEDDGEEEFLIITKDYFDDDDYYEYETPRKRLFVEHEKSEDAKPESSIASSQRGQTLLDTTSPSSMLSDVVESMLNPGFNNNVVLFISIIFMLLFVCLTFLMVATDYNLHVIIFFGLSVVLFVALHWLFASIAKVQALAADQATEIEKVNKLFKSD